MVNQTDRLTVQPVKRDGMARSAKELIRDCIALGELQARLLLLDLREGGRGAVGPMILIAAAACAALGSFPVILSALALAIAEANLPLWACFLIAGAAGLLASAVTGYVGWRYLKRNASVMNRSRTEFQRSVAWLKATLRH